MPIKVLHLISSLKRGGRERQLSLICANSLSDQYTTIIVYFNTIEKSYIDEYNLTDKTIQVHSKGKVKRLIEIHRILLRERPNIIYSWGNGESVSTLLLKPFHSYNFINGSIRHGIRLKKISHFFRSIILHISPHIVANSKAGLKANNLQRGYVLYNGIDNKFFSPLKIKQSRRKEMSNVSTETPILVSVANLVPHKDYFSIISALSQLSIDGYSFYYFILGDGPLRKEISSFIQKKGLGNHIKMMGNVENVSDYLKISDVFIHSSQGEGCSNAILEAMAAGLPIIASNTGGTSEIVGEENGWLFEYKNQIQLYEQIKHSFENLQEFKLLGNNSIKIIKKRFSVEILMHNYYFILGDIMSKHK